MDDLDQFRAFRADVEDSDASAVERARIAVARAAAEERANALGGRRSLFRWRGRRLLPVFAASVLVAGVVALAVVSPWTDGPPILQLADAAISPQASQVLYMQYVVGPYSIAHEFPTSHYRVWIEGAAPRDFRSTQGFSPRTGYGEDGGTLAAPTPSGTQSVTSYFDYDPLTHTLIHDIRNFDAGRPLDFDPLAVIRHALTTGTAHVDGHTEVDGKPAIRITLWIRDSDGHVGKVIYLANATTYAPIEIRYPSIAALGGPFDPIFGHDGQSLTIHFQTFEYLSATPVNLALANILEQHPTARMLRCMGCLPQGAVHTPIPARSVPTASRITPKDVSKIAPLVRACMLTNGATKVEPFGTHHDGGVAFFANTPLRLTWSWVDVDGAASPGPPMVLRGSSGTGSSLNLAPAIERNAVRSCLDPYERGPSRRASPTGAAPNRQG